MNNEEEKVVVKFSEEQQCFLEEALQCFTPPESVAASLGLEPEAFYEIVENTYGISGEEFIKRMFNVGICQFQKDLVQLSKTKPTSQKLLYDVLVARGLLNEGNPDKVPDTSFNIEFVNAGETADEDSSSK